MILFETDFMFKRYVFRKNKTNTEKNLVIVRHVSIFAFGFVDYGGHMFDSRHMVAFCVNSSKQ